MPSELVTKNGSLFIYLQGFRNATFQTSVSGIVRVIIWCPLSYLWTAGVYSYSQQCVMFDKNKFLSLFIFVSKGWWLKSLSNLAV